MDVSSKPDIFSKYNGKKFIGDAKYYRDPENANFDKEFRTYNILTQNKYPMCVFVPAQRTRVLHVRTEDDLELVVFNLSVEDVVKDAINESSITIEKIHTLLFTKGNTIRIGPGYDTTSA